MSVNCGDKSGGIGTTITFCLQLACNPNSQTTHDRFYFASHWYAKLGGLLRSDNFVVWPKLCCGRSWRLFAFGWRPAVTATFLLHHTASSLFWHRNDAFRTFRNFSFLTCHNCCEMLRCVSVAKEHVVRIVASVAVLLRDRHAGCCAATVPD